MTSGPFHCARTHSTSFQVTVASKLGPIQPWKSLERALSFRQLARDCRACAAAEKSDIPSQPGRARTCSDPARQAAQRPAARRDNRDSASPGTARSTVRSNAPQPASLARAIMSRTNPRSLTK